MEEAETVAIGGRNRPGDAHHQDQIHEAMGGVAAPGHALMGDIGQYRLDIAGRQPLDRLAVEFRIGTRFPELARPAQLQRQMSAADGGNARISFADTGTGIAPEVLPHIFEPFYTTRPDGSGLGLAIVRKIVAANAARIAVESHPGAGARFVLQWPLAESGVAAAHA